MWFWTSSQTASSNLENDPLGPLDQSYCLATPLFVLFICFHWVGPTCIHVHVLKISVKWGSKLLNALPYTALWAGGKNAHFILNDRPQKMTEKVPVFCICKESTCTITCSKKLSSCFNLYLVRLYFSFKVRHKICQQLSLFRAKREEISKYILKKISLLPKHQ